MADKLPRIRKAKLLWSLHQWVGFAVTLFLILFVITGIALNHTELLGIHGTMLDWPWLIEWYYGSGQGVPASVPLARWLLDLHTGSFFGMPGTLMMDLAAIAMLFLLVSGIINWWRRRQMLKPMDACD